MVASRLLLALLLLLHAPDAIAAEKFCADIKTAPTKVTVNLELPKPFYDLKQSLRDINQDRSGLEDWVQKNGMQEVWQSENMTKLGYAQGGAALMSMAKLDVRKYDMYGVYYCLFISEIDVAMMFRTRIVIPKELKKGGCRFNTVLEHELRHYQANGKTVIKFTERLEKDLPHIVAETEKRQPYVLGADVQKRVEDLKASVKDAIEAYIIHSMRDEMERVNGLIDTPEEYASSGPKMEACPD